MSREIHAPWQVVHGPEYASLILTADRRYRITVEGPFLTDPTREAIANRIGALPDLLRAVNSLLEHCVMMHKSWGENCNQRESDAAIAATRAAIAKAEAAT